MNTNLAANIGANEQLFFSGNLSGPTGTSFTISGSTPFVYDPASGDLLLTILSTNNNTNIFGYLDASSVSQTARTLSGVNGNVFNQGYGLVTQFDYVASAVPEPSTWAMMLLGFAGVGWLAYRRRNKITLLRVA